jgi:hypothetical protein
LVLTVVGNRPQFVKAAAVSAPLREVADEILVDLMAKASGIDYHEASQSLVIHEIDGVPIPFASPELLWRMKCRAGREKDRGDIEFLRQYFMAKGIQPPMP